MTDQEKKQRIREEALRLGFACCGFATADAVSPTEVASQEQWLAEGKAAGMDYMHRNKPLRYDPRQLVPGAHSIIVVAMNYYPQQPLDEGDARFAYYAYGADYHYVMKQRLEQLLAFVRSAIDPHCEGRAFCDSAPLMERYWAEQAGVGFRGRNGLIIVPGVGSYVFLGEVVSSLSVEPDQPLGIACRGCHACEGACPTCALSRGRVDARLCISYQTIENRTDHIPDRVAQRLGGRIYGCDACQQCCPWNRRFARGTVIPSCSHRPSS